MVPGVVPGGNAGAAGASGSTSEGREDPTPPPDPGARRCGGRGATEARGVLGGSQRVSKTVKERVKRAVASMLWGSRGHRGSGEGGGVWGKAWGLEKGARPRGPGRARWGGGCEGGTPRLELCWPQHRTPGGAVSPQRRLCRHPADRGPTLPQCTGSTPTRSLEIRQFLSFYPRFLNLLTGLEQRYKRN